MNEIQDQEIEVKFYVQDLERIEARLIELGAQTIQARTHEINLRFDTPENEFKHQFRVLRLRMDTHARLTYKGPGVYEDGARTRQEIEFIVSDFSAARRLLEALGYQVAMVYEKYRAIYDLSGLHVALDELPYGRFVEIEGPNIPALQNLNQQLGLNWQAAVNDSYAALFDRLCVRLNLPFRDLIFDNFQALTIRAADLGVHRAD